MSCNSNRITMHEHINQCFSCGRTRGATLGCRESGAGAVVAAAGAAGQRDRERSGPAPGAVRGGAGGYPVKP